jgi:hypothetical protein
MPASKPPTPPTDHEILLDALRSVMAPLARLAVARGLTFSSAEETLKHAFVLAARDEQIAWGHAPHRLVSRVSTVTGINRREVTRLMDAVDVGPPLPEASLASQVFTRWLSDPSLQVRGKPRTLPRQGVALSFESLARSVTQDVHPRSLLDELCRLQLARWDVEADTVSLLQGAFTPHGDWQRMMGFLGSNVGDHLDAAVQNVLADVPMHFEQAVFADGLSAASVEMLRDLARRHWKLLLSEAVPLLDKRIKEDARVADGAHNRVRLGLFTYHEDTARLGPSPHAHELDRGDSAHEKTVGHAPTRLKEK